MIECAKKNHVVLLEAMRPDFDPAFDMIKKRASPHWKNSKSIF